MAGQLVQVATNTITSAVASVTIYDENPTDNRYIVAFNNILCSSATEIRYRFTTGSGTEHSGSNYDQTSRRLQASADSDTTAPLNQNSVNFTGVVVGTTVQSVNGIIEIINAGLSDQYTYATHRGSHFYNGQSVAGYQGGACLKATQVTTGIKFFMQSGNLTSGSFTLYKQVGN